MLIGYIENGKIIFIKDGIIRNYNPTATEEEKMSVIEKDVTITLDLESYSYDDYLCTHMYNGEEITDCEDQRQPEKDELETKIANTINAMVLSALPDGETLTKENAPTLVDIIKPENQGDKPEGGKFGDINNPIAVVGNVSTDGYLYTYGLYYSYGGKKYKCERGGAPDTTGSIKLYYTPDQLIGHYFTVA